MGARRGLLVKGLAIALLDQCLSEHTGEFLAPGEDRPGQYFQTGRLLLHCFLQDIQPEIETLIQLSSGLGPSPSLSGLLQGKNWCRYHLFPLHPLVGPQRNLFTLPQWWDLNL
jgi:hypothetical protein